MISKGTRLSGRCSQRSGNQLQNLCINSVGSCTWTFYALANRMTGTLYASYRGRGASWLILERNWWWDRASREPQTRHSKEMTRFKKPPPFNYLALTWKHVSLWQLVKWYIFYSSPFPIVFFSINAWSNRGTFFNAPPVPCRINRVRFPHGTIPVTVNWHDLPRWTKLVKIGRILKIIVVIFHWPVGQDSYTVVLAKTFVEIERVWLTLLSSGPPAGKVILYRMHSCVVVEKVVKDLALHLKKFNGAAIAQVIFKTVVRNVNTAEISFNVSSFLCKYCPIYITGKRIAVY